MEEKTCKYCQKQVSKDAIKCPYCREWLNKTSLSWRNPLVYLLIMVVFIYGSIGLAQRFFISKYQDIYQEPISYNSNRKLKIISSRLIKEKTNLRIMAEIQNDENFNWDSVEIVGVFKDKNGNPLYLSTDYMSDLKPGEKRLFQLDQPCSQEGISTKDFSDYEIKIETASARPWRKK